MAKEGLLALVCATAVVLAAPASLLFSAPPDEPDNGVAAALAVQTAIQQAREHLLRNRPQAAVEVLHRELARINGNSTYLALLRDAYQASIKELRLANREKEAQKYVQWLSILDPQQVPERKSSPPSPPVKAAAEQKVVEKSANRGASPGPPSAKTPVIRATMDEDPFNDPSSDLQKKARQLLLRADQDFNSRNYGVAGALYAQAFQADNGMADAGRERWAYCKLFRVVQVLNQAAPSESSDGELEKEVNEALVLAPRLEYGRNLLAEIRRRRHRNDNATPGYREVGRTAEGWFVGETANFRVYHAQTADLAAKAAEVAEQTRTSMYRKWFGAIAPDWNPKCELYLHPTGQDYCRVTGAPADSPGHSDSDLDGGRVISRRIHLHCDISNMLEAVLPHETTHVVLAGNFGDRFVPRWADEGIAVHTEPRERVDRYLTNLPRFYQGRQWIALRQLVQMEDNYPDPQLMDAFYAESVSLVEFLVKEKGPLVFTQFVREGRKIGYEAALQKYYGYRDFADFEQRWSQFAFGQPNSSAGVAQRVP
jgi:hypothetical protein